MKKITFLRNLIVLVALLIGSGSLSAQLLVENFDYTIGSLLTANGWSAHSGAGTQAIDVVSGLEFAGYAGSGIGGAANLDNNGEDVHKTFAQQTSGTVYAAFLVKTQSTNSAGYFFHFGQSTIGTTFFIRLWVNASGNGVAIGPATPSYYNPITPDVPVLLVIKLDIATKQTSLFVLNSFSATEPESANQIVTETATFSNVGSIALRQYNASQRIIVDGIRVGTTWAQAVAPASTTVATPTFSPEAGSYTTSQNISISTATADAIIYYTTNGDTPTESSSVYSDPFTISATTTVKAKAFKSGMTASDVATAEYVITQTPTIQVTEETVPAMSIAVGGTDTETITVNASNLTGNITLAVTGDDADLFTLSTYTLVHSSGSVSNQSVTITYTPDAPATLHTATLTLSSPGAESVPKNLSGSATLAKPTATDATGISPSGFTANWDAVPGATSYELKVYKKEQALNYTTDLIISEYGEGSTGNKKYVEIYNGTGNTVDLSNYSMKKATNGGGWPAPGTSVVTFSELSLPNNTTYVIANNATDVVGADLYNSNFANWNGDDAIGLFKNDLLIDVFGTPDSDPGDGWSVAGISNATKDKILIRKSSVSSPNADWTTSAGTTVENSEWIISDFTYSTTDQTTNIGSHSYDGLAVTITPVSGSPFTVTGETSKAITGLTSSTQYFYTVKAKNGSFESLVSEEESVITSFGTSTDNPSSFTSIYAYNAKIHFIATAGEKVEVYNAVGQKIISTLATDGQNELPVSAKGVMIVKVGSRLAKVIL